MNQQVLSLSRDGKFAVTFAAKRVLLYSLDKAPTSQTIMHFLFK